MSRKPLAAQAFSSDVSGYLSQASYGEPGQSMETGSMQTASMVDDGGAYGSMASVPDDTAVPAQPSPAPSGVDKVKTMLRPLFNTITHWGGGSSVVDKMLL